MRMQRYARSLAFVAVLTPSLAAAGQLDGRLMGAWAQSEADCKEAFVSRNGRWSLKQPVNGLYVAFIVEPGRIRATTGECRIGNVTVKAGRYVASLSCNNSIGFVPVSARFQILDADRITYGSSDDPTMDSKYLRCR